MVSSVSLNYTIQQKIVDLNKFLFQRIQIHRLDLICESVAYNKFQSYGFSIHNDLMAKQFAGILI
ncbi:hypothetical protein OC25_01595 [Pedobacter kyungheensis]|uniref:Uncharacterized protein n=1 Tax=Pedobacter kyungheensis TaxID=1069985 RepID=A0A0C1DQX7_9SPHI|nr:hypothetical protein OC25_01595 [Pedobacter kyungheensis]